MIEAAVIPGDSAGKELGYPTANLGIPIDKVHLRDGIYAARAWLHSVEYKAALVVQVDLGKTEVHLLGYDGPDFYGEQLRVDPIQKISERKQYTNKEDLRAKIAADLQSILDIV